MKKSEKCRYNSPRPLDLFVMWLGFELELHAWNAYRRRNGDLTYFCRRCECGANQVQNAGPCGNGKWRDIDSHFYQEWEREHFDAAEILEKE